MSKRTSLGQSGIDLEAPDLSTDDEDEDEDPRSKMVCQRKCENFTGRDGKVRKRFLKWNARLAVIGTGEGPGVDKVWSTFSPTIGFGFRWSDVVDDSHPASFPPVPSAG